MSWDMTMHALGVACLCFMGGIAVDTLITSLVPQRARIWRTLRGHADPAPRAASVGPHPTRHPQLRGVEAAAEPTSQVS